MDNKIRDPLNRIENKADDSKDNIISEILEYGKRCTNNGLVYGNFGNLSIKYNDDIYITRSGAMMSALEDDIISFQNEIPNEASSDTPIHYGIYKKI